MRMTREHHDESQMSMQMSEADTNESESSFNTMEIMLVSVIWPVMPAVHALCSQCLSSSTQEIVRLVLGSH